LQGEAILKNCEKVVKNTLLLNNVILKTCFFVGGEVTKIKLKL